jgi:hypothetical protein
MPLSRKQVVEDFLFFRDQWSSDERSFTEESRAQMLEFVDGEIAAPRTMPRYQLALLMSRAMAFAGDNHSRVRLLEDAEQFHVLPFSHQ